MIRLTLSTPRGPELDAPGPYARPLWQIVKLVLAALLAYAAWRGYHNPDLVLDLAALRLC